MAAKFKGFLESRTRVLGYTGVTFQINADAKERIDRIAVMLNKSSSEIYRALVEASLADLEEEVDAFIAIEKKAARK